MTKGRNTYTSSSTFNLCCPRCDKVFVNFRDKKLLQRMKDIHSRNSHGVGASTNTNDITTLQLAGGTDRVVNYIDEKYIT